MRIQTNSFIFIWAIAFLVSISPLFLTDPLPLGDYLSHLARMHIIANIDSSEFLPKYYALKQEIIPNLAMDLIVPIFTVFLSASASTLLFTILSLFLLTSGPIAVNYALHKQLSFLHLSIFLLVYNREFLWGFLNNIFGLGLAFWIFYFWIMFRTRPMVVRFPIFAALALVLFICHLHALGAYAIMVLGYEFSRLPSKWTRLDKATIAAWALTLGQFLVPFILLAFFSPTADRALDIAYAQPIDKVIGIFGLFNNYNIIFDALTFLIVMSLILAGFFTKTASVNRLCRVSLLALIGLFLVLPDKIFGSYGADRRVILVIALLYLASVSIDIRKFRMSVMVLLVLTSLFLIRQGIISYNWVKADKIYAEYIDVIDSIEVGSRLAAAVGAPIRPYLGNPPVLEIPNLAIIRRDALVNSLLSGIGHQPVKVIGFQNKPRNQVFLVDNLAKQAGPMRSKLNPFEEMDFQELDYFMMINWIYFPYEVPNFLVELQRSDSVVLYKIDHQMLRE